MVYRDDVEALEARHAALEAEVAERARARDEAARLLAEARAHREAERQLADLASGGPTRRRRRRILIAAVVGALALVGVGVAYRLARSERDHFEQAIAQFSRFADQMCSCSNDACTRQVSDAMAKWGSEMAKDREAQAEIDDAQKERALAIARKMGECMAKATSDESAAQ